MTIPFDTHHWKVHPHWSNRFVCSICGLEARGDKNPNYQQTKETYDWWTNPNEYDLTCDEILIRNIIE
jgi:hypothetical protein